MKSIILIAILFLVIGSIDDDKLRQRELSYIPTNVELPSDKPSGWEKSFIIDYDDIRVR